MFFVPVKWNPNFVSWSPLESLQRRGAGIWVMMSLVRAHDIMTVVTTLRLCVTVTRDTGSVLRPELSAQWKLSKAFILSLPMDPGAYLTGQPGFKGSLNPPKAPKNVCRRYEHFLELSVSFILKISSWSL